jgi:hypothetical protein
MGAAAMTEARAALLESLTGDCRSSPDGRTRRQEVARQCPRRGGRLQTARHVQPRRIVVEVDTSDLGRSIASVSDIGRQATVGVIVVGQLIGTAIVMAILLQPELEQFQGVAYLAMIAFAVTLVVSSSSCSEGGGR